MALQLSTAVRNARLDAIESTIGVSAILRIRSGAPPANVAAAATGTVLATFALASDWAAAASAGAKALSGLPVTDSAADATGTAGHFEIVASDGTTRHVQGTVTATGGGGDMTLDNTSIAAGQAVNITGFTLTDGNA
jgi:hypothetical protein